MKLKVTEIVHCLTHNEYVIVLEGCSSYSFKVDNESAIRMLSNEFAVLMMTLDKKVYYRFQGS